MNLDNAKIDARLREEPPFPEVGAGLGWQFTNDSASRLHFEPWSESNAGVGQMLASDYARALRMARMALGVVVNSIRIQRRWSPAALAAQLQIEPYDVFRLEHDASFTPSLETTANLAEALGVSRTAFQKFAGHTTVDEATLSTAYDVLKMSEQLDASFEQRLARIRELVAHVA